MQTETRTEPGRQPAGSPPTPHAPQPAKDLLHYLKEYAREKPEIAALTCFAVGFVLGWKLKPW